MIKKIDAFWTHDETATASREEAANQFVTHVRNSDAARRCWDGTWKTSRLRRIRFAEAVWAAASQPTTSHAYVRDHPRVISGTVQFNSWDCSLTGIVELAAPWPQGLSRSRAWERGGKWMDWPVEATAGEAGYRGPTGGERTRYRYLMALTRLVFPLSPAWLPAAPSAPDRDLAKASGEAIRQIVSAMNMMATPGHRGTGTARERAC